MRKEKKTKDIIKLTLSLLVIFSSCLFLYNWFINKSGNTDKKYIKENSNSFIAILVEDSDGNYEEKSDFPTNMYYNSKKSGCVDLDGNSLPNALKFDVASKTAEVTGTITAYCYLYFDMNNPAGSAIIDKLPVGLNTTSVNGMYRFVGVDVNNYVELEDKIYRIIGIVSEENQDLGLEYGQLKLISEEIIKNQVWHQDLDADSRWNVPGNYVVADIYTYLNNNINNVSAEKIANVKWNAGVINNWDNATNIINYEDEDKTTVVSKYGLMYLSDYYYAYQNDGNQNCKTTNCVSWMTSGEDEWTMSRFNYVNPTVSFYININGSVAYENVSNSKSIRPVFYLTNDVNYKSGTGSLNDPFVLE